MDQETSDFLFGVAVLVPFLIVVFVLGFAINRFKNRRFVAAWRPLVPIIDGKVIADGGGAATSWLAGSHDGRAVRASMTPNRNRYSNESGETYNHFDVSLADVPGRSDWQVAWKGGGRFGLGRESWHVESDDPLMAERLQRAGVLEMIRPLAEARAVPPGIPSVCYRKSSSTLTYSEDAGSTWIPAPERFREQLTLLLRLAQINTEVNTR